MLSIILIICITLGAVIIQMTSDLALVPYS